jgi:hypothetical protein
VLEPGAEGKISVMITFRVTNRRESINRSIDSSWKFMATLQTELHVVEWGVYRTIILQVMGYLNCIRTVGKSARCFGSCSREIQ